MNDKLETDMLWALLVMISLWMLVAVAELHAQ